MFINKAVSALRTQSLLGKAVLHIIIRSSKYEMCHKRRISNVSGSKEEIAHSNFKFSGQVSVLQRSNISATSVGWRVPPHKDRAKAQRWSTHPSMVVSTVTGIKQVFTIACQSEKPLPEGEIQVTMRGKSECFLWPTIRSHTVISTFHTNFDGCLQRQ